MSDLRKNQGGMKNMFESKLDKILNSTNVWHGVIADLGFTIKDRKVSIHQCNFCRFYPKRLSTFPSLLQSAYW